MSIKILVAYATLALIIFVVVAQTVHVSIQYVRANTIPIGELTTVVDEVSLGDAQSVHANVALGLGQLTTKGGALSLMEATYTTNVTASLPISSYAVTDGVGLLQITHDGENGEFGGLPDLSRLSEYRSHWDLAFTDKVPLDLALAVGKGTADIDLAGLYLTALIVDMGQGELMVDLRGSQIRGNQVEVTMGQGDTTIDLRGDWREDAVASLSAGLGHVTALLPADKGVVVHADDGISDINVEGLTQDGDQYINDSYGQSDITLTVELEVGLGDIDLIVSE